MPSSPFITKVSSPLITKVSATESNYRNILRGELETSTPENIRSDYIRNIINVAEKKRNYMPTDRTRLISSRLADNIPDTDYGPNDVDELRFGGGFTLDDITS